MDQAREPVVGGQALKCISDGVLKPGTDLIDRL
jgi:hypothetical protein